LIKPSYRCYLLLNIENKNEEILYGYLKNYKAEYLPYMGKNDFSSWWTNFKEYNNVTEFDFKSNYNINSIFSKTEAVSRYIAKSMSIYTQKQKPTWIYFEKLPICFDENLFQYRYGDFVYSNATFNSDMNMSNNGKFYEIENNLIIQLF
jgi:CRISPR-associated protein Cas5h